MATATKKGGAKGGAKASAQKRGAPKGPREKIEAPKTATFDTDDKRAQYARLVVFNYAKKNAKALGLNIPKDADVNSVSNAILTKAAVSLAGGNELKGAGGLEIISSLTKAGATDEKVKSRGLTKAYAAEVRPFLRRAKLAPSFGRRGAAKKEKAEAKGKADAEPKADAE